jgi:DNA-binding transcriptional regulator YiaG
MPHCRRCRAPVVEKQVRLEVSIDGRTFCAHVNGRPCARCKFDGVEPSVRRRFALVVASHGELGPTGAALRFMRDAMDLRATELASLLDVSSETWSRWENGKRAVPLAPFTVVRAMVHDALAARTTTLDALRALASPTARKRRVMVGKLRPPSKRGE